MAASYDAGAVSRESGARAAGYRTAAWTVGALLGLLLVLLAGTRGMRESIPAIISAAPSSSVIAVLPFAVHGDPRFAYLGEGMLDLLSTNLDGAGELRTVDPRALLSFVARDSSRVIGPERGRAVAVRFGAGRYVLGEVVEAGGRLRITASLYDQSRGPPPVAHAMVEGEATELFALVDELTTELLGDQYDTPGERLARSAAVTTHSLPALKAYLEGEAQLRAGRYSVAMEAFQRAIAEDTSFALAYYRLSVTADWFGRIDQSVAVSERAIHHRDRLSEHDRLLVEAYHAFRHGAASEAEALYRTIVSTYPDDLEAWYQLGEILFHSNPPRGRSFTESRGAFERVLSLDAGHHDAVMHMVRVAAYEGKRAELHSLIERALPLTPPSERLELRAFRAFSSGNPADQDRLVEELRTAADGVLWHTAWRTTVYARNLAAAERASRLLVDSARPPHARAQGYSALIPLLLGQGRLRAARAELQGTRARRLNTFSGIRAHWAAFRFFPANRAEIIELRGELLRQDASIDPDEAVINRFNAYGGVYPQKRVYQLGLLSARLGEDAEERSRARQLDAMGTTPEARALSRYFAAVIRADLARARNQPREALAFLDRAPIDELPTDLLSAFGAQVYAAWMRAELLRELGHHEAALAWFERRGFVRHAVYSSLIAELDGNPMITAARVAARVATLEAAGYEVRRGDA
ncbi:MAG: hypothetical protein KY464_18875, partial [Gemmatimonadetes bacterium]|nr:hypothetical protein [Gemmatimonadota bacterium]